MSRPSRETLRKAAPRLIVAGVVLLAAGALAVTSYAGGPAMRPLTATVDLNQTCSTRVPPNTQIDVGATVLNTGTENLQPLLVDGDAGTPDTAADDFVLTHTGGDTNGDNLINPGETWTYTGAYTAPTEDVTNNVGIDAVSVPGGTPVNDVAPCSTDVVQTPAPGVIAGVKVAKGTVLVKVPGSPGFVKLNGPTEIPMGSQLDTTHGTVTLTAGLGDGKTNSADFYDGLFTIFQSKARNAYMTLRLDGGNFGICKRKGQSQSVSAKSKKPVRRVWGSGKGRFTTRGRYSSATVRGTKWLTLDRCDGTYTKVIRGIVQVRDFRRRKNVSVRAGHSYLALAR